MIFCINPRPHLHVPSQFVITAKDLKVFDTVLHDEVNRLTCFCVQFLRSSSEALEEERSVDTSNRWWWSDKMNSRQCSLLNSTARLVFIFRTSTKSRPLFCSASFKRSFRSGFRITRPSEFTRNSLKDAQGPRERNFSSSC